MPECEICGKTVDTVYEITLDGAQMLVCEKDARGREVLNTLGPQAKESRRIRSAPPEKAAEQEEELIENYGEAIRKAREALALPLKVLAEKISEKESTLVRIEKQKMLPSEKTRRKIEKELGIRLSSKAQNAKSFIATKRDEPLTLWDVAKKEEDQGE